METSCLEADLGAEGHRLSQESGWAGLPCFILFPVSLPNMVSQTCPTNCPRSSTQSSNILTLAVQRLPEKRGLLRVIPLAWHLASLKPNTLQDQPAALAVRPWAWGLAWLVVTFSLSDFSPPPLRAAPGEAQQA